MTPPSPTPSPFHPSQPQVLIVRPQTPSPLPADLHLCHWVSMASLLMAVTLFWPAGVLSSPWAAHLSLSSSCGFVERAPGTELPARRPLGTWLCATVLLDLMLGDLRSRVPPPLLSAFLSFSHLTLFPSGACGDCSPSRLHTGDSHRNTEAPAFFHWRASFAPF